MFIRKVLYEADKISIFTCICGIIYCLSFICSWNAFPEEVKIFAKWDWFQNTLLPLIKQSYIDHPDGLQGFQLVVYSGTILLLYSSLLFFISKIPVIEGFGKTITGFIAFFSIILIIIGVLLCIGVFPL